MKDVVKGVLFAGLLSPFAMLLGALLGKLFISLKGGLA